MDYISTIKASIGTSVLLNLFKNEKDASMAHLYKSKFVKTPLTLFQNVENFNPNRLQKSACKAYPVNDRPRGINDINSVKYHQKQLQQNNELSPIWLVYKNKKYILLDGAHRIVASHIENEKFINSYVISLS